MSGQGEDRRLKYHNELAALHDYIASFDPEQFSTRDKIEVVAVPSPERRAELDHLRARLARKRQMAESIQHLCDSWDLQADDMILTQSEVDALLEGWVPSE